MKEIEEFLKNSIALDRNFPVDEARWEAVADAIHGSKDRRGILFFLFSILPLFLVLIPLPTAMVQPALNLTPAFFYPQEDTTLGSGIGYAKPIATDAAFSTTKTLQSQAPEVSKGEKQERAAVIANSSNQAATNGPIANKDNISAKEEKVLTSSNKNLQTQNAKKQTNKPYRRKVQQFDNAPSYSYSIIWVPPVDLEEQQIPYRSTWMASLSFGVFGGIDQPSLPYFTTQPNNVPPPPFFGTRQFYRSQSGEEIDAYYAGRIPGNSQQFTNIYELAILRQFNSGITLKGGLIHMQSTRQNVRLVDQLPNDLDLFYRTQESSNFIWIVEAGIQHTFLRRRRIQPYIGANIFWTVRNKYISESRVLVPSLQIDEVNSRVVSQSNQAFQGFYLESGFQYRLDGRISIGPSLILPLIGDANNLGYGLQARYRW